MARQKWEKTFEIWPKIIHFFAVEAAVRDSDHGRPAGQFALLRHTRKETVSAGSP
jgi:hypothetical protein